MGDELEPELLDKKNSEIDEDPLAELARIVAGEPEPDDVSEPETPVADDPVANEPEVEADSEHASQSADQGAAVAEETQTEPVTQQPVSEEAAETPEPEVTQEVESALAAVERDLEAAMGTGPETGPEAEEVMEPQAAEADTAPQPPAAEQASVEQGGEAVSQDADNTFQDDLISALRDEIDQPQEAEPNAQFTATPAEPVAEATQPAVDDGNTSDPHTDTGPAAIEEALMSDLANELGPGQAITEPEIAETDKPQVSDVETVVSPTDETLVQSEPVPEAVEVQRDEPVDMSPANEPATPAHSLDDDLGAAFANEFEHMQTQSPDQAPQVIPELQQSYPEPDNPAFAHQEAGMVEPAQATAASDMSELDFGAAFAEELGVDAVTEAEGWGANDTQAAHADFTNAVMAEAAEGLAQAYPEDDPGHVGAIPGISDQGSVEPVDENQNSGSWKYAMMALAIALLAGSAVTVYGFLGGGNLSGGGNEPRLIVADTEPFKVVPDDPGGRVPLNQDKASYEKVAGEDTNKVDQETLISETEEPAELEIAGLDIIDEPDTNLADKSDDRLEVGEENVPVDTNVSSTVTPRVVQTVIVNPDGTIVTGSRAVTTDSNGATDGSLEVAGNTNDSGSDNLANGVITTPKPVETVTIKKPESIDGASSTGDLAVPQASPLPKPEPEPVLIASNTQAEPDLQPVRRSEYVVQVSSQRSPEAAQASFQNLKNRFAALQGRAMSIQKANVNGATFYRVRVNTDSKADADGLCSSLQASGGSCFVTR